MANKNMLLQLFKNEVEKKFFPKIEYLHPKDIRDIFSSLNFKDIENMTDKQLINFYTEWYVKNEVFIKRQTGETDKPNIEE